MTFQKSLFARWSLKADRRIFYLNYDPSSRQPWKTSEDKSISLLSLTQETLDGAMKLMQDSFIPREALCVAVDITSEPGAAEEFLTTCLHCAADGVSIVAKDNDTDEIVGVMFNKLHVAGGYDFCKKLKKSFKHKASNAIIDFTIDIDSKANVFERYNVDCIMELAFAVTKPDFAQKNIAVALILASMELGNLLNKGDQVRRPIVQEDQLITPVQGIPNLITSCLTSTYTQRLRERLDFDKVVEVSYDDYSFNGKTFSERIGDCHKTCMFVAKRLPWV